MSHDKASGNACHSTTTKFGAHEMHMKYQPAMHSSHQHGSHQQGRASVLATAFWSCKSTLGCISVLLSVDSARQRQATWPSGRTSSAPLASVPDTVFQMCLSSTKRASWGAVQVWSPAQMITTAMGTVASCRWASAQQQQRQQYPSTVWLKRCHDTLIKQTHC